MLQLFLYTVQNDTSNETILTPFSVKDGMTLAEAPHPPLQDTAEFDCLTQLQNKSYTSDYIKKCKLCPRKGKVCRNRRTEGERVENDDVVSSTSDTASSKQALPKFKLLQFAENHRPAYYGTWRKTATVNPRNPFRKDEVSSVMVQRAPSSMFLDFRACWTMRWIATWNGRRRNKEKTFRAARYIHISI